MNEPVNIVLVVFYLTISAFGLVPSLYVWYLRSLCDKYNITALERETHVKELYRPFRFLVLNFSFIPVSATLGLNPLPSILHRIIAFVTLAGTMIFILLILFIDIFVRPNVESLLGLIYSISLNVYLVSFLYQDLRRFKNIHISESNEN